MNYDYSTMSESRPEHNHTSEYDEYYPENYFQNFPDEHTSLNNTVNINTVNIIAMVIYGIAFFFGVLGNGLVIWVTGFKMKKTVNTVWFLNLAVADFIFTIFLPLSITYIALDFHWPFGHFLCKINTMVAFFNMFASVFLLTLISIDRCLSTVCPIWSRKHRTPFTAMVVSFFAWIGAMFLSAPYLAFRDTYISKDKTVCFNNFALSNGVNTKEMLQIRYQAMIITRFLCGFLFPLIIIVTCNTIIGIKILKNQITKSSKPFKVIIVVIVAFVVCWFPYHVISLLQMVCSSQSICNNETVSGAKNVDPLLTSLAFLNSCINPVLYAFMGRNFRVPFKMCVFSAFENAFSENISISTSSSRYRSRSSNEAF